MSAEAEVKETRVIRSFLAALVVVVVYFAVTLFYSLPSNVLSARDNGPIRQAIQTVAAQQFGYFTRDETGEQLEVYRLNSSGDDVEDLVVTPQNRPANLFGFSRKQRAQGPEISDLINYNSLAWSPCAGSPAECVISNKGLMPAPASNRSSYKTVCGDVFVVVEVIVDWNYRKLVDYPRRSQRVSHLDVSCS